MKKILFPVLLLLFFAGCESPASKSYLVPKLIGDNNIPAIQMVHYQDNGVFRGKMTEKLVFTNEKFDETVTDSTIFQAASLSKVIFAYTVLRLVDQGVLELDVPLMSYYDEPRFRTPENREMAKKLTARMVLSHRTGLPNWAASPSSDEWPDSEIIFKTAPAEDGDTTEMYTYSGEGYAYLQRVVEHLTGLTLNELASREVFEPFEMPYTWYGWRESYEGMVTRGHQTDGTPANIIRYPRANSAYTLMTCAGDYSKFLKALAGGKGLKPETFAEMTTPQYEDGDFLRIYSNIPISWGLGVGLTDDGAIWHWGDNGSFKAFFAIYPSNEVQTGVSGRDYSKGENFLVYFANSRNGLKILPQMLDIYFPDESLQVHQIPLWLDIHYGD